MFGNIKKVAAIHDLSGYGRASLTVIIPTLSAMGVQVCPLPTAILSTHSGGFEGFSYVDLTDHMSGMIEHWKRLGLHFDCVYSGFLGSPRQIDIVEGFIDDFAADDNIAVVDPVMGDNGKLYVSFTEDFIPEMRRLVKKADIITPNFTEAAYLLGMKEVPKSLDIKDAKDWLKRLSDMGPGIVIITSAPDEKKKTDTDVLAYDRGNDTYWKVGCPYIPAAYPGTGDIFTSVVIGGLLGSDNLPVSLDRATQFISQCIKVSYGSDYPKRCGVLLEKELGILKMPVMVSGYEMI